ncbi:hypothetical protein EAG_11857 [Camponotus floridanus]|uniref:Uncharacterized protein n=1 Tax=Camponotus floridanus TaxID=104421 RepID=E2AFW9_CAMFO|nr:hypothetical protein EAG_11857 [Camponotus floridanus]
MICKNNLLAFCGKPMVGRIFLFTQQLHLEPEQSLTGRPPPKTQLILRPHLNFLPLYMHVCGITETDCVGFHI